MWPNFVVFDGPHIGVSTQDKHEWNPGEDVVFETSLTHGLGSRSSTSKAADRLQVQLAEPSHHAQDPRVYCLPVLPVQVCAWVESLAAQGLQPAHTPCVCDLRVCLVVRMYFELDCST